MPSPIGSSRLHKISAEETHAHQWNVYELMMTMTLTVRCLFSAQKNQSMSCELKIIGHNTLAL